jgi:hypothetical protein
MYTLKIIVRGFLLLGVCLLSFIPQGLMQSKSCASELVLANRSKKTRKCGESPACICTTKSGYAHFRRQ